MPKLFGQLGYICELEDPSNQIIIDHNVNLDESGSSEWDEMAVRGAIGKIYTYNYTNERKFSVALQVADYEEPQSNAKSSVERAKTFLRKWVQPKVSEVSNTLVSPPPVLMFSYSGMTAEYDTTGAENLDPVRVIMPSYRIVATEIDAWRKSGDNSSYRHAWTPAVIEVVIDLVEVETRFRNF